MIEELHVEHLGVLDDLHLVLGSGMTVITGETGTGKTLVVEAVDLLLGGRADPVLVGPGADEARVEARVLAPPEVVLGEPGDRDPIELIVTRVVPRDGRSRAYLDGRLATAGALAALGERLVDLHGQHDHQALATPAAQREALDAHGGDATAGALAAYRAARTEVARCDTELASLGGDERSRAREADLLRHQVDEIDGAAVTGPDEDDRLAEEADLLADATAHREAAIGAHRALAGPGLDGLGTAARALAGRAPFAAALARVEALHAEVDDLASELRRAAESVVDDPGRLDVVLARRRLLADLRRRYGDTLAEVLSERDRLATRLEALVGHEARAALLAEARSEAQTRMEATASALRQVRESTAARLGPAVTAHLRDLGMAKATLDVRVEASDPGEWGADRVTFLLHANPGLAPAPLSRVASGGELARCMLALRLVLGGAPPVQVFDEVDAGIGGEAGVAVGAKLATLGRRHQVVCVTHLAQVAAFADHHVVVRKWSRAGRTRAAARPVVGDERVAELARMLAGSTTPTSLAHARELLERARGSSPAA